MKKIILICLLLLSIKVYSQPGDPTGDPDTVETPTANPKEVVNKDFGYWVKQWVKYFRRKKKGN